MTDKNANTEIRKEFCPNCEAETPCTHEAELYVCDICGEDFAKYIVSRNCSVSDVSMTRDVSIDIKTGKSVEIEELEEVVEHLQIRLSEWRGVARQLSDELKEEISSNCTVIWEDVGETSPAWIAYNNLVDTEDYETNPDYYKQELASRDASLLTEGEQKEILSYIRGNYDRDKIPTWLLDLIDGIARRDEIIKRLVEDGERMASNYVIEAFPHEWVCRGGCHHWARFGEQIEHSPDCPITLHRALMKELEKEATDADN